MSDVLWPVDYSSPGSSVRGILQERILEWAAISSAKGSSWPKDGIHVSCTGRQMLYHWVTWGENSVGALKQGWHASGKGRAVSTCRFPPWQPLLLWHERSADNAWAKGTLVPRTGDGCVHGCGWPIPALKRRLYRNPIFGSKGRWLPFYHCVKNYFNDGEKKFNLPQ